jgi:hypothetical protein
MSPMALRNRLTQSVSPQKFAIVIKASRSLYRLCPA